MRICQQSIILLMCCEVWWNEIQLLSANYHKKVPGVVGFPYFVILGITTLICNKTNKTFLQDLTLLYTNIYRCKSRSSTQRNMKSIFYGLIIDFRFFCGRKIVVFIFFLISFFSQVRVTIISHLKNPINCVHAIRMLMKCEKKSQLVAVVYYLCLGHPMPYDRLIVGICLFMKKYGNLLLQKFTSR